MALVKTARSKYWYVDFTDADGVRRRVSTATTLKHVAKDMEREIRQKVKRTKLGIEKVDPKRILFKDFFRKYIAVKDTKSVRNDEWNGNKWLIPAFGEKYLHSIKPEDVARFRSDMAAKVAPSTVNRQLALLRSCLNTAVDWGYIHSSPVKVKMYRERPSDIVISEREQARLFDAIGQDRDLRDLVIFLFTTGCRKSEALKLKWCHWNGDFITFVDTKSGSNRKCWVGPRLREILVGRINTPSLQVFPSDPSRRFRAAARQAGLSDDVTLHTIRHTVATRLSLSGVDLATIGRILGHKSYSTTMRYAHPGNVVEAMKKL